jgi:hypothetical protein
MVQAKSRDDLVSADSQGPEKSAPRSLFWHVRLPEGASTLPPECACCGAVAAREIRLSDGHDRHLLLGYCDVCVAHVARAVTRKLSLSLASLLLGVTAAAGFPIALPWLSLSACVILSATAGTLPLVLALVPARPKPGHAALGRCVRFAKPQELICESEAFAFRVAQHLGVEAPDARPRARSWPKQALFCVAVPALLAVILFLFHHPLLRVMNLGDTPLELWVDGRLLGRVEPSSGESPTSGLELRVPSGLRRLVTRSPESVQVTHNDVVLHAGSHHLYVPVSGEACFWLETTGYGREQKRSSLTRLGGEAPFFVVPEHVEGWFVPSAPIEGTARATGGTTTVLRQGPCSEAQDPEQSGLP